MKVIRRVLISFVIIISCNAYSIDLSGVWYNSKTIHELDRTRIKLSWGTEDFARNDNSCIAIDNNKADPLLYIGGNGMFQIISITSKSNDLYEMVFYFARGGFDITCRIHVISDESFWIEDIDDFYILNTGEDNLYYCLSRPPQSK